MLLQGADDLLFAEPASLHRLSPRLENRLTSKRGRFRGAGRASFHSCERITPLNRGIRHLESSNLHEKGRPKGRPK
ncbi:hypothetical protein EKE94_09680 [Mesobaculum littorinae]|uniref:Uncharacterized protein n=1 Tax=Mesobaculum littorinae TaxID=2486419 RepID=A0A438AGB7_9RHOB|nr:hypothetical protein EKE94_09680 [Mesobaculum littorinae]